MEKTGYFAPSMWWRFSHYRIDDDVIRPAPGAELVFYDPWEEHRESRRRRTGGVAQDTSRKPPPAYQELILSLIHI